jgi:hypothetical protein
MQGIVPKEVRRYYPRIRSPISEDLGHRKSNEHHINREYTAKLINIVDYPLGGR